MAVETVLSAASDLGMMIASGALGLGETIALACRAERAGVAVIGAGDGVIDNAVMMGALAGATERVGLMTAITGWTRTPVSAAVASLTLAEMSGGRYRLGLGTMPRSWSEDWHDVTAQRPLGRMRDYVAAIRQAWRSGPDTPVHHDGPYYRFRDYAHPGLGSALTAAPPPISLAVSRPKMARLAGEIADGALFNLISSAEWIAAELVPAVRAGRADALAAGPARAPFELATCVYCAVDADVERAIDWVRPALGFYFLVPYFADALRHHGFERELAAGAAAAQRGDREAMTAAVSDEVVTSFALVGSEADITRRLGDYRHCLDRVMLTPPICQTPELTLELSERIIALTSHPQLIT